LSEMPGPLGMLSKMSGRYVAFYADDLATMLMEDFLTETVKDLQKIENKARKEEVTEETKELAEEILGVIKTF
jgi:hypothetical protein